MVRMTMIMMTTKNGLNNCDDDSDGIVNQDSSDVHSEVRRSDIDYPYHCRVSDSVNYDASAYVLNDNDLHSGALMIRRRLGFTFLEYSKILGFYGLLYFQTLKLVSEK